MKSYFRLCLLLIISSGLIASCKKPVPKQTSLIPKNAVFVATINTKSLHSKLMQNQATLENIIKNISGSDTTVTNSRQEFEDLKSSGIDLDENFYVAVVNKGGGMGSGGGAVVTSVIGALKDEGKLEAYLKKKDPGAEVRKEKDYRYTTMGGDKLVAWDKDIVVLMSYQKSFSATNMEYDSTGGSFNMQNPGNAVAEMRTEIESDLHLKEDQTVAAIPEFRDLMQEKSDASIWVNSSSSMENIPLPLPQVKELLSNSFTAAKIDFDDGRISLRSKSYYSPQLRDLLKKYSGPTADLALVENYPSDNINAFGIFSFNPEFINALVKYLELGAIVDQYLTKMMGHNYTLQEALRAIKGDVAVVVSDFASSPSSDTATSIRPKSIPDLKLIVNIPVGDKAQMNRLMDRLVEMQMLVKTNNEYRLSSNLQQTGYQLEANDKNLFISSDPNLLNQYKTKSRKAKLDTDILNGLKSKSGVVYVNIESILNGIPANNPRINEVLPKAKETFKDAVAYTENFNGKYLEGHGELHFKNEKQNSLTSFLSFVETVSRNLKKDGQIKGAHYPNDVQIDTVQADRRTKGGGPRAR
jgi:hypothetical protein